MVENLAQLEMGQIFDILFRCVGRILYFLKVLSVIAN